MLSVLVAIYASDNAVAADRYAVSQSPRWEVGRLDPALSQACRRLEFNQQQDHRIYIGYAGKVGTGTTGVGKKGWNLRDPHGLAEAGITYHFFDDGYSDCRVFVSGGRAGR